MFCLIEIGYVSRGIGHETLPYYGLTISTSMGWDIFLLNKP